jgi:hypothetical protein
MSDDFAQSHSGFHFNKKLYWCRGRFTDYKVFSSRVKIAAN